MSSVAAVNEGDDTYAAVARAIELAGGPAWRSGDRVVVKPNIAGTADPHEHPSAVTRPEVTIAVARYVLETGGRPVIAESGVQTTRRDVPMAEYFAANGLTEPAARLGVRLVDITQEPFEEVEVPGGVALTRVRLPRVVRDADAVISVPALKHHFQAVVSLSLKNMKGCLHDDEKRLCHQVGLEQAIADYCGLIRPALAVVDAWKTRDRIKDRAYDVGLVLAGRDPVAVDAVGARLMGFEPVKITALTLAAEAGLGRLDDIETVGDGIEGRAVHLSRPPGEYVEYGDNRLYIIEKDSCSGCWSQLRSCAGEIFKRWGDELAELSAVMGSGRPARDDRPTMTLGDCARRQDSGAEHAPGCPPSREAILDAARRLAERRKGRPAAPRATPDSPDKSG